MAAEHLVRFTDQALGLGNAFPQGLLAGLDLDGMTLPPFNPILLGVAHQRLNAAAASEFTPAANVRFPPLRALDRCNMAKTLPMDQES